MRDHELKPPRDVLKSIGRNRLPDPVATGQGIGFDERNARSSSFPIGIESHSSFLKRLSIFPPPSTSVYLLQLQRRYGNRYVQRVVTLTGRGTSERVVPQRAETPQLTRKDAGDRNVIQRFKGERDFIKTYEIEGSITGGFFGIPITGLVNKLFILAGTSGELTLSLEVKAVGKTSGFIKGGIVFASFSLEDQKIPYRCTPEGEITIETAAISPGHPKTDSSSMNPVGSDIGITLVTSVDGSTPPKYLTELITFTVGGGGIPVSVSKGPVSVGGPTLGGGGSEATSLSIRVDLAVVGQRPASGAAALPTPASAAATATATVVGSAPVRPVVPPPHSVYFADERQTIGDQGDLVKWAASLPIEAQDAIRTGRLTTSVVGYASTTGTERSNYDRYSRQRAEWVRPILAHTLGVNIDAIHVAWRGSYTAPPEDLTHPGGVPNRHERRADITFAETAPMTPVSVTAGSSATAGPTTH